MPAGTAISDTRPHYRKRLSQTDSGISCGAGTILTVTVNGRFSPFFATGAPLSAASINAGGEFCRRPGACQTKLRRGGIGLVVSVYYR